MISNFAYYYFLNCIVESRDYSVAYILKKVIILNFFIVILATFLLSFLENECAIVNKIEELKWCKKVDNDLMLW